MPAQDGPALVEECFERSVTLLKASIGAAGFVASSSDAHYGATWTRDAVFSGIGAALLGEEPLLDAIRRMLMALGDRQSPLGQMPNTYWPETGFWDWGEAGSTDATCLYVIAACQYLHVHGDDALRQRLVPVLRRAHTWLTYQDANNSELIDSPEAGDWMDSSLNRSGKVMYINVLYYWATRCLFALGVLEGDDGRERAARLRRKANLLFWPEPGAGYGALFDHVGYGRQSAPTFPHDASLAAFRAAAVPDRSHYLSHVQFGRFVDLCDCLGNILAIISGLADRARSDRILTFLATSGACEPYPMRSWVTAIEPASDEWQMWKPVADHYQDARWRNEPGRYHNGAVWPFIGGFYVAALALRGRIDEAQRALVDLARANRVALDGEWGFHEWIDARTGAPGGAPHQCWNAGAYVLAYRAVRDPQATSAAVLIA